MENEWSNAVRCPVLPSSAAFIRNYHAVNGDIPSWGKVAKATCGGFYDIYLALAEYRREIRREIEAP